MALSGLGCGPRVSSCESCKGRSVSVKSGEFLYQLIDRKLIVGDIFMELITRNNYQKNTESH
jgi:hypothetical protein